MTIASGSGRRVSLVPEVGWAPAYPTASVTWENMRITGGGMQSTKLAQPSDEIRSTRQVPDTALLGFDAAGSYDFEMVYGWADDLIKSVMYSSWVSHVIKNGNSPSSVLIEEVYETGGTDTYARYRGCRVNSMSLNITARQVITGSFGIIAKDEQLSTAALLTSSYTDVYANRPVMTASANVASLSVLGISSPRIRSLTLEINNSVRPQTVIGDLYAADLGEGKCSITGTIEAYLESNAFHQQALDHTTAALSFTIGVANPSRYTFAMARVYLGQAERVSGGNSDDVLVRCPFTAVYDSTAAASLTITRQV